MTIDSSNLPEGWPAPPAGRVWHWTPKVATETLEPSQGWRPLMLNELFHKGDEYRWGRYYKWKVPGPDDECIGRPIATKWAALRTKRPLPHTPFVYEWKTE